MVLSYPNTKSIQVCLPPVVGKWFRYCHSQARTSSPGEEVTFQKMKQLQEGKNKSGDWEEVSFPTPPHSDLDYVYTVDLDTAFITVSTWTKTDGIIPSIFRAKLADVHEASDLSLDSLLQKANLKIDIGTPTPLNEPQFRLFTDFIFQWRFYINDHTLWQYTSTLLNTFVIAILRLAAWDLGITHEGFDSRIELPINFRSVPGWKRPETDIFWLHGFLVVCDTLNAHSSVTATILRAKAFLNDYGIMRKKFRLILISLRHVELSEVLPLVINNSAEQCSPGFRALTHVLSSSCWKGPLAHRERWGVNIIPEIFDMMLKVLRPRDILSFCQSSLAVERWYYSSVTQFGDYRVQHFDSSVPYCGYLDRMESAVCCSHVMPGNIRRKRRGPGCRIRVAGHPKILGLRLSLPTHLRLERQFLEILISHHRY
ncbi:uncharacterized protein EURHEDRAFT_518729 [Aspergillus ruber CBS 135680]|uniref:Uncharacterized protein n=1 Tax=Aspergillus ruber (strain CBS 135680) TaxID=1388766 RepID=A0A017S1Y6_ASPRC|nr:uncharacterized protein EURHEDRAFT_518729 [Aspergillus ruber CBS 135680]EYE90962.1 hypothetical protein EURHEDRAFT_518729 [Aspergillus ruber CBS 135680]